MSAAPPQFSDAACKGFEAQPGSFIKTRCAVSRNHLLSFQDFVTCALPQSATACSMHGWICNRLVLASHAPDRHRAYEMRWSDLREAAFSHRCSSHA